MPESIAIIGTDTVKSRMVALRGQATLLDRDVALLYGVETREVNQAVRNNPDKFPAGYVFQLNEAEFSEWRSKILMSDLPEAEKTRNFSRVSWATTSGPRPRKRKSNSTSPL